MPKKSHRIIHRRARVHRRRAEPTAPHSVLATIISLVAASSVVNGDTAIGVQNLLTDVSENNPAAASRDVTYIAESLPNSTLSALPGIVLLSAVAIGVGWAGRKYGKSYTNVSKKWRVV